MSELRAALFPIDDEVKKRLSQAAAKVVEVLRAETANPAEAATAISLVQEFFKERYDIHQACVMATDPLKGTGEAGVGKA
jgi:hypothetical protein